MNKQLIILVFAVFLAACTTKLATTTLSQKELTLPQIQTTAVNRQLLFGTDFDWLLGDWLGSNDTAGKTTFEKWYKKSDQAYQGIGYTLENQDTVFKENLRLVPLNNQ